MAETSTPTRRHLLALLLAGTAADLAPAAAEPDVARANDTRFPDATNTGVPPGTALEPAGDLVVEHAGAVIERLDIRGGVVIRAANVTLRSCKITYGGHHAVLIESGVIGATVEDCTIDNLGAGGQGIAGQGRFRRNDIHGCADGIDVRGDRTLIADNYIHDLRGPAESHFDGIQANSASHLLVERNTVINENGQTSAVMIDNDWSAVDDVTVSGNLLVGGGYTVYVLEWATGGRGKGPVTNVSIVGNRIGRGRWGAFDIRSELGHRPFVSGNVDAKSGRLLPGQSAGRPAR